MYEACDEGRPRATFTDSLVYMYQLEFLPPDEVLNPSAKAAIIITSPEIVRQPFETYHLTFVALPRTQLEMEPLRGCEILNEMRSM